MAKLSQKNVGNSSNNASDININSHNITKNTYPLKAKRTRKTIPRDSPPQRSSIYRGVTKHRWTGRYEAHLWDKNCWNESQKKKGRQVYLGAYDQEEAAAHAYDLAALKYWGSDTILNFPLTTYQTELKDMEGMSREEYIGSLRRKSSGFSRGVSKYRGVARHHHNGRWEARIGRVFGNKYLYLGTYATQEEAAVAYDMAAIEYRGLNAVTNFDLSRYIKWLKPHDTSSNNLQQNSNPSQNNETRMNITTKNHELETNSCNSYLHHNHGEQFITPDDVIPALLEPATATSALALLLQSSKYKEMIEMSSAIESPSTTQEVYTPKYYLPEEIKVDFEPENFRVFGGGGDFFYGDLSSLIFDA